MQLNRPIMNAARLSMHIKPKGLKGIKDSYCGLSSRERCGR